jgi:hypothetical protein
MPKQRTLPSENERDRRLEELRKDFNSKYGRRKDLVAEKEALRYLIERAQIIFQVSGYTARDYANNVYATYKDQNKDKITNELKESE